MDRGANKAARLFGSVVGAEHVAEDPPISVDGHAPAFLLEPGSIEEAAHCLAICSELKLATVPAGLMSWLDCGNPLRRADVVLCLRRLDRVIDYSPPDLIVTLEAGATLQALDALATPEGQWLPLDPPGRARSSLGAIVSCASSGPLRSGFGAPRDYVIGLRLAHADGKLSRSGGKVVKNVAGYDMNKLYVGSFGTLAAITEVTFKLRPRPEKSATLKVEDESAATLGSLAKGIFDAGLQPASTLLASGALNARARGESRSHYLLARFIESEAAVDYQVGAAVQMSGGRACVLAGPDEEKEWGDVTELDRLAGTTVRVSVPISRAFDAYEDFAKEPSAKFIAADLGAGIIRAAFDLAPDGAADEVARIRSKARERGGTAFVERAELSVRRRAGAWDEAGSASKLMKSIKSAFDPEGLLNPGKFAEGI